MTETVRWRERVRTVGVAGVVGLGVWLGGVPPVTFAEEVFIQQEELPIGLPDFPREAWRRVPELKPEQEIKVGILKLHPSFRSAIEYNDNIRLSDKDDRDDVIFIERPAVIGEMKLGDHRLEAGYGTELLQFAKEQEENTTNHLAHGLLELNFKDFQLMASEAMEDTTGRLFTETVARDHVFLNTVQILGRYDRPMWALESGWIHNTIDHKTPIFNEFDYGEDVLALLGGYKLFPKTLVLLETDVGFVNYDRNTSKPDHTYWQLLTGVRGELLPKVTSTVKVGFQSREFSELNGESLDERNLLVADAEVVYSPRVSDVIRFQYLRTLRTSTYATNNYYRQDKISVSYRKRFARKWLMTPGWSWQSHGYPRLSTEGGRTETRDDFFNQLGAELRYEIQEWLSSGVAYNFVSRNSNLDTLDYENNRITFDVTVAF